MYITMYKIILLYTLHEMGIIYMIDIIGTVIIRLITKENIIAQKHFLKMYFC